MAGTFGSCLPVFIDQKTFDMYYNGYSNEVLWPLFHYIPLPTHDRLDAAQTLRVQWAAYQRANRLFSRAVLSAYQEGDVVWCHDYHLALLPQYLKELRPSMKVGWFLHTPFPSSEIFRTLPLRSEILRGVLHADLTGFHTYDYARHFVSACTRILGLEGTPAGVEDSGRVTRVCAFPIGVDPERFWAMLRSDSVRANIAGLRERFAGKKVMLGVDRLDVIKGIPQKLLAFEKFLEENPEWRSRVLLVQVRELKRRRGRGDPTSRKSQSLICTPNSDPGFFSRLPCPRVSTCPSTRRYARKCMRSWVASMAALARSQACPSTTWTAPSHFMNCARCMR